MRRSEPRLSHRPRERSRAHYGTLLLLRACSVVATCCDCYLCLILRDPSGCAVARVPDPVGPAARCANDAGSVRACRVCANRVDAGWVSSASLASRVASQNADFFHAVTAKFGKTSARSRGRHDVQSLFSKKAWAWAKRRLLRRLRRLRRPVLGSRTILQHVRLPLSNMRLRQPPTGTRLRRP